MPARAAAPPAAGKTDAPPATGGDALGAIVGDRARWLVRFWKHAAAELDTRALRRIYDDIERPLVPVLAAMERHGIRVEPARLEEFAKELERNLDNLTREIYALAGENFTISSPKQLAQILFEKLKLPALRRTKTGYSTDADVLTELAVGHPLPAKVLEHRTLSKLKGTYADALPLLVNPATGRIHTTFNQLVAATGRLSEPGSESHEHPHPHRAGAADPGGVRAGGRAGSSWPPTTRRSSCASSRTSPASRPSSSRSSGARTSTPAPPARCSGWRPAR